MLCPFRLAFVLLVGSLCAVPGARHDAAAEEARSLAVQEVRVISEICGACHVRPGIDVPQLGDETAWEPRRAKGMDALLRNTIDGYRGMPPLGTCSWCSEASLRRIIAVMAGFGATAP